MTVTIRAPHQLNHTRPGFPELTIDEVAVPVPTGVVVQLQSAEDFALMQYAARALRRAGYAPITLALPYVPGAAEEDLVLLETIATAVNACEYDKVFVADPGTKLVEALFKNVEIIPGVAMMLQEFLAEHGPEFRPIQLVGPRAGIPFPAEPYPGINQYAIVTPELDPLTGDSTSLGLLSSVLGHDTVIILNTYVRDTRICEVAELAKNKGALSVHLLVTHGIFLDGYEDLLRSVDSITYIDSYGAPENPDPRVRCKTMFTPEAEELFSEEDLAPEAPALGQQVPDNAPMQGW